MNSRGPSSDAPSSSNRARTRAVAVSDKIETVNNEMCVVPFPELTLGPTVEYPLSAIYEYIELDELV